MDIDVFIDRRKALKLSQVKLCEGICTQATLSKFENNNRIPSLTILSRLYARLGLTVDELYQDQEETASRLAQALDTVEEELMTEDYRRVLRGLAKINVTQLDAIPLKMQFYYLRGIVNTLVNRQPDKVLFDFSRILNDLDERHQTIMTQLAFLGSGILYARRQEHDQAVFYFEKVRHYLRHLEPTVAATRENNYHLRVLTLIYYTAEFYAGDTNYKLSNQLINSGLNMCSDHHVTYYLPRLKFLAAQNALAEHRSQTVVSQLLDEALAFARLNRNEVIEVKVAAMRNQVRQTSTGKATKPLLTPGQEPQMKAQPEK